MKEKINFHKKSSAVKYIIYFPNNKDGLKQIQIQLFTVVSLTAKFLNYRKLLDKNDHFIRV